MKRRWQDHELLYLKQYYSTSTKNQLIKHLQRTWAAIILKANSLNLHYPRKIIRNGNLDKLLEDTPHAYYWAGFIAADGTINHTTQINKKILARKEV